jgi:undecaprenyl-diphosphatase
VENLNQYLFLLINNFAGHNSTLDYFIVSLGEYTPYIFILFEIYLYFYLKLKDEALFGFYSMLLALSFSKIVSIFYIHNRPFVDNIGVVLSQHKADSSFPSDHTTFVASIAISLLFFKPTRKYGYGLLILALFSGIARIYEGVHYTFDILFAFVIAFVSAYIIYILHNKLIFINRWIIKIIKK